MRKIKFYLSEFSDPTMNRYCQTTINIIRRFCARTRVFSIYLTFFSWQESFVVLWKLLISSRFQTSKWLFLSVSMLFMIVHIELYRNFDLESIFYPYTNIFCDSISSVKTAILAMFFYYVRSKMTKFCDENSSWNKTSDLDNLRPPGASPL